MLSLQEKLPKGKKKRKQKPNKTNSGLRQVA